MLLVWYHRKWSDEEASKTVATIPEVGSLLKIFADPTRLRIFLLLREGEACVCELATNLALAENLVSHHLSVLRKAQLVLDRRDVSDGRWVYYHLDPVALRQVQSTLNAVFDPTTLGTRTPTCGPTVLMPQRQSIPRKRS